MITPELGPAANAITYGSGNDTNRMAEFYRPDMPADPKMGALAEAVAHSSQGSSFDPPHTLFLGHQCETNPGYPNHPGTTPSHSNAY